MEPTFPSPQGHPQHLAEGSSTPIDKVARLYACFGEGNLPGILALLDPAIQWHHAGDPRILPMAGVFHGHDGVAKFIQALGQSLDFSRFEVHSLHQSGDQVENQLAWAATVQHNQQQVAGEASFVWIFNNDGFIAEMHHTGDMQALEQAFQV